MFTNESDPRNSGRANNTQSHNADFTGNATIEPSNALAETRSRPESLDKPTAAPGSTKNRQPMTDNCHQPPAISPPAHPPRYLQNPPPQTRSPTPTPHNVPTDSTHPPAQPQSAFLIPNSDNPYRHTKNPEELHGCHISRKNPPSNSATLQPVPKPTPKTTTLPRNRPPPATRHPPRCCFAAAHRPISSHCPLNMQLESIRNVD